MITRNRILAMLLALALLLAALPMAAFSANALETYVIDRSLKLALGDNALTLDANAITTIYEFKPSAAGIYRFTAAEADALVGYWGAGTYFVFDQTQDKTNTLEVELKNLGPSIMVGISGVSSCTLKVENLGDSAIEVEPEWEQYVNVHTPTAFTMPNYCDMRSVNVLNTKINQAIMGSDGFYHLDAADGPLLVVDFAHENLSLQAAHSYGQVRRYYFDDAGKTVKKLDFYDSLEAYMAAADGTMYPVTEDIKTMLVELGDYKGWYVKSEFGSYMFEDKVVNPDEAWMFVCYYLQPCQLKYVEEVPATYESTGTREHWKCAVCMALYADAAAQELVEKEDLEIPQLVKEEIQLEIVRQPQAQNVAQGDNAIFAVEANGEGLTYRWQYSKDGGATWLNATTSMSGYKSTTLTLGATKARNGYLLRCKVTDQDGNEAFSEAALLTVEDSITFTAHPQPETVKLGNRAAFTVAAEGDVKAYQWQYQMVENGPWWNCTQYTMGYNTTVLNVIAAEKRQGFLYRCRITDSNGNKYYSNTAELTVDIPESYALLSQPKDTWVMPGKTTTFHVETQGEGLTYQWEYHKGVDKSGPEYYWIAMGSTTGCKTDTLTIAGISGSTNRDGWAYRCVVTDKDGYVYTTDHAFLYVADAQIDSQPEDQTVTKSGTANFHVEVSGEVASYQWQYSKDGGKSWYKSSSTTQGYNTDTLTVAGVSGSTNRNGFMYRCIITDVSGNVIYSTAAQLNVLN